MRLGLTGGIGSGKTLVVTIWRRLGRFVIEADEIARTIVQPGSAVWQEIVACFGADCLLPSGILNRAWLRQRIFTDATCKKQLESIMHPVIRQRILAALEARNHEPLVLVSAPLLLETGLHRCVDKVVVVDAEEREQIARVMQRDHTGYQQVEQIMAMQYSREQRRRHADFILDNRTTVLHLYRQIRALDRCLAT